MLGQAKPFASLSSTLLARKGQARPAMRPQGYASLAPTQPQLEDLGWNDMGAEHAHAAAPAAVTPIAPVEAAPAPVTPIAPVEAAPVAPAPVPQVLLEREALRGEFEAPAAPAPVADASAAPAVMSDAPVTEAPRVVRSVSVATAARLERETAHRGRAAFTLRLDAERHLKLRLASALSHSSAQQLVTHALDQLLLTMPEVDALVAQLPPAKSSLKKRVSR